MRRLFTWVASLFRSSASVDADLRDETAFHLDARTETLITRGLSPDAARRQAQLEFGSVPGYRERAREAAGYMVLRDFWRDVQFGFRMLRRQPGTAIVIVVTLALGIGANTAIFSVVDAVLLRRLPVSEPDRLVLFTGNPLQGTQSSSTPPTGVWTLFSSEVYESFRTAGLPFAGLAAFESGDDGVVAHTSGSAASVRASAHLVSGNYFDVMGVRAAKGRALTDEDDAPGADPVAVISTDGVHAVFHDDPNVVGRSVMLNQTSFTVVGVMPESFFGERIQSAPYFWVPLARQPEIQLRERIAERSDYYWLNLVGRLAPGDSRESAETAAIGALRLFLLAHADKSGGSPETMRHVTIEMASGARGIALAREHDAKPLSLLLIVAAIVLLVACANVATLLLCRATSRSVEVGVRRALGASRMRLVRQWLTESGLMAAIGAGLGVLAASFLAPALQSFFPFGPVKAGINGAALGFATTAMFGAAAVFGIVPALHASRADTVEALGGAARGTPRRKRTLGATEPFVIAQIAASLVLVFGATLFARTLFNLEHVPLGFDQDRLLLVRIDPRVAGYTPASVGPLYRRLLDEVRQLPGVASATFARYSPLGGWTSTFSATVEGYTPPVDQRLHLNAVEVGPDYPKTLGMSLLAGRAIGPNDDAGAPLVAMVNDTFARTFFPNGSPVGHHVTLNRELEIVGVVGDASFQTAKEPTPPFVFTPVLQDDSQRSLQCEIDVRTLGDAGALVTDVRRAIESTDSRVVVTRTRTLREQVLATFGPERLAAGFVGAFAILALLIAAVGLFGVVSHGVVRRTKEMGVRLALGAAAGDIVWLIVRETLVWIGIGVSLGAAASVAAARLVASQLFGVTPRDAVSFAIAAGVLILIGLAASLIPALRAIRIRPTIALRAD
jgi:predicted permease